MLMTEVAPSLGVELVVLHFDHRYRADSVDDARFVEAMAASLGLPCRVGVNPDPKPTSGLMAEARRVRYRFFDGTITDGFCQKIVLAHTMDDVAETSLMRMLRGGGPGAFGGPKPVRGPYVRPLLDVRKDELIAYLTQREIAWRVDPTNESQSYLRNRVRATILPTLLAEEPTAVEAIARLAGQVAAHDEVVTSLAVRWLDEQAPDGPLPLGPLRAELVGLRLALIRLEYKRVGGSAPLSAERVEEVDRLVMNGSSGSTVEFPGGYAARIDQTFLTVGPSPPPPPPEPIPFARDLTIGWGGGLLVVGGDVGELIDMATIPDGATFRTRRPGDSLALPAGSRSLKRYLIDKKVPASTRDQLPLLASGDRILWVPGLYVDATLVGEATCRLSFKTRD